MCFWNEESAVENCPWSLQVWTNFGFTWDKCFFGNISRKKVADRQIWREVTSLHMKPAISVIIDLNFAFLKWWFFCCFFISSIGVLKVIIIGSHRPSTYKLLEWFASLWFAQRQETNQIKCAGKFMGNAHKIRKVNSVIKFKKCTVCWLIRQNLYICF